MERVIPERNKIVLDKMYCVFAGVFLLSSLAVGFVGSAPCTRSPVTCNFAADGCGYILSGHWVRTTMPYSYWSFGGSASIPSAHSLPGYLVIDYLKSGVNTSDTVTSPCFESGTYNLTFWYFMTDQNVGLSVRTSTGHVLISNILDTEQRWKQLAVAVHETQLFQIIFDFQRSGLHSVGLDDISIEKVESETTVENQQVVTTAVPLTSLLRCDFVTSVDSCDLTFGDLWKLHTGPYKFHGQITLIPSGHGDDAFALFDSTHSQQPSFSIAAHDLMSPVMAAGVYNISFWYIAPQSRTQLDLVIIPWTANGSVLWTGNGETRALWKHTSIQISTHQNFRIAFRGVETILHGHTISTIIGVDKLRFTQIAPITYLNTTEEASSHAPLSSMTTMSSSRDHKIVSTHPDTHSSSALPVRYSDNISSIITTMTLSTTPTAAPTTATMALSSSNTTKPLTTTNMTSSNRTTVNPSTSANLSNKITSKTFTAMTMAPSNRTTTRPSTITTMAPSNTTTTRPSTITTMAPSNRTTIRPSTFTTMAPSNRTITGPSTITTMALSNRTITRPSTITTMAPSNRTSTGVTTTVTMAPSNRTTTGVTTTVTMAPSNRTTKLSIATTIALFNRTTTLPSTTATMAPFNRTINLPSSTTTMIPSNRTTTRSTSPIVTPSYRSTAKPITSTAITPSDTTTIRISTTMFMTPFLTTTAPSTTTTTVHTTSNFPTPVTPYANPNSTTSKSSFVLSSKKDKVASKSDSSFRPLLIQLLEYLNSKTQTKFNSATGDTESEEEMLFYHHMHEHNP